jgi:hypothetical protein
MLAMYHQIDRVRAVRQLDAAQAAAYPHMDKVGTRWLDGVLERARGIVEDVAEAAGEQLHWNGKVVSIAGFKRQAARAFGKAVGR